MQHPPFPPHPLRTHHYFYTFAVFCPHGRQCARPRRHRRQIQVHRRDVRYHRENGSGRVQDASFSSNSIVWAASGTRPGRVRSRFSQDRTRLYVPREASGVVRKVPRVFDRVQSGPTSCVFRLPEDGIAGPGPIQRTFARQETRVSPLCTNKGLGKATGGAFGARLGRSGGALGMPAPVRAARPCQGCPPLSGIPAPVRDARPCQGCPPLSGLPAPVRAARPCQGCPPLSGMPAPVRDARPCQGCPPL
eukprot:gene8536-biopygen104